MTTTQNVDAAIFAALKSSHYPGARDESVYAVIAYCRAMQVDPMLKPVHIVPMQVENAATREKSWRDVIMPGIGLYRIIAERSGAYAGSAPPTFGPIETYEIAGQKIEAPAWCDFTVRKIVAGHVVEFTAREFFLENVATTKEGRINAMWFRRKYGQLAKCAEAQALRRAFPDSIPAGPIDGETITDEDVNVAIPARIAAPAMDLQAENLARELRERAANREQPVEVKPSESTKTNAATEAPPFDAEAIRARIRTIEKPADADEILDLLRSGWPDDIRRALFSEVLAAARSKIKSASKQTEGDRNRG